MPNPTDPPRPSLESSPYADLSSCGWDTKDGVVNGSGVQIFVWLNILPSSTIGKTVEVYWEVGTAAQAGQAVRATIPQDAFDIIKNGTYDPGTGLIAHQGEDYSFRFEMISGVASMKPYKM